MSYLVFSLLFVAAALVPAVVAVLAGRTVLPGRTVLAGRAGRRWWVAVLLAMAALVVLTIVFDSLMVAVGLFRYDQTRALGIDVGLAPLEDLTWPVASAVLLPSLWVLSDRVVGLRSPARRSAPRRAPRRPRQQPGGRPRR